MDQAGGGPGHCDGSDGILTVTWSLSELKMCYSQ
jgi:hypothetical protein